MTDIQKLGEVAHLAQQRLFKAAQRLASTIKDPTIKAKAQDVIDSMKGR